MQPSPDDFAALADNIPQLAWMADADGWIFWYNKRWYDYTGTTPSEMEGWGWQTVHDPAVLPEVLEKWRTSISIGLPFDMVFPIRAASGEFRPFLTRVEPIRDASDNIVRWFGTNTDISQQQAVADALSDEKRRFEILNRTAGLVARELELDKVVQRVTDAGVELTGAQFGAFFYNVINHRGESYTLYAISGVDRSHFDKFPMPRKTDVFDPTFRGTGTVRSDDITKDPRYGKNEPHQGMPEGHLPVRSYLAVPVVSRSKEVLGGLFFGHPDVGVFSRRHEDLIVGVAAHAAVGIDNARLYATAQAELEQRRNSEKHRQLLVNELNHRVKNTLATVQSIVSQTLRTSPETDDLRTILDERLMALSGAHDLLTREHWETTSLSDVVKVALGPYQTLGDRFTVTGPEMPIRPKTALAFAMALHELATNAAKYGALSEASGRVSIEWSWDSQTNALGFCWKEYGGPPVVPPTHRGVGSRMIEQALAAELGGTAQLLFPAEGVKCVINTVAPGRSPQEERT